MVIQYIVLQGEKDKVLGVGNSQNLAVVPTICWSVECSNCMHLRQFAVDQSAPPKLVIACLHGVSLGFI